MGWDGVSLLSGSEAARWNSKIGILRIFVRVRKGARGQGESSAMLGELKRWWQEEK